MTQNNLGIALASLGERQGGPEGLRRLTEAVEAYRQALAVCTRDDLPQDWATTQNNLGNALQGLGERSGGGGGSAAAERGGRGLPAGAHRLHPRRPAQHGRDPGQPGQRACESGRASGRSEGVRRLSEAVEAYRQALTVYTRDDLPQALGHDPEQPGQRALGPGRAVRAGPEGLRRLTEAVDAYRQALTVHTRDDLPQDWATTQNNLGVALADLGERLGGRRVCGG